METDRPTKPPHNAVVSLGGNTGAGPLWGMASEDLNVTLLAWPAGEGVPEHVNEGLDVVLVVIEGSGTVSVGDRRHEVEPGVMLLIEKGVSRAVEAGPSGVRYLSVHLRRPPLQLEGAPPGGREP